MEAFVAGVELWQKFLLVLEPIRVFFGSNRPNVFVERPIPILRGRTLEEIEQGWRTRRRPAA
jgi:hypothetical protein